jgi:hypothetical protein
MAMAKALDWRTSWLEMALSVVFAGWADCTPVMCRQRRAEGAVGCESTRRARRDERGADMMYMIWDSWIVLSWLSKRVEAGWVVCMEVPSIQRDKTEVQK